MPLPAPNPNPKPRLSRSMADDVRLIPDYVCDDGETIGPVDYACVRRHRHRRLATYLWLHGFRGTLRGLVDETDAFISVAHLSGLLREGLWDDAIAYLSRFLPPGSQPLSDQVQVLIHFIRHHRAFASMVAGVDNRHLKYLNHKYNTLYLKHDASVNHDDLRIRSIILSLLNSPQVRASLDWERVRHKASQIVYDLAFQAPELKDLALLPGASMMPHDVLPIGFRSRRRHYVKEQDLPRAKSLAKIFLRTKKRIASSTRTHELNTRLTDKTRKWVVDIIDESLQAGRLELQSSGKKKGVPGATVLHTMSNTLTDLTRNSVSGTSSLTNAGALVTPVSQIMSGTLTVPSKISGAPVAAVSQAVNLTSHAESSGIPAVINAGVPGATVLHTMLNTLTDLTRNSVSGTSSLANAGAPVAAVSQAVNLTSHAESSRISAVINAGTSKLLGLENSNLRKHPRTEDIIFEQDPHPKVQRTSGAFGEACLTSMTKGEAGAEGPNHEIEHA